MGLLDFAGSILGGLIGGGAQYASAQSTNQANEELAEQQQRYYVQNSAAANAFTEGMFGRAVAENRASADRAMDFERTMSSTAYQRASEDLREAGLNPILLAHQPSASTPNAPSPTVSGGHGATPGFNPMPPRVQELGPAVATAFQLTRLGQELRLGEADVRYAERRAGSQENWGDSAAGRFWDTVERFLRRVSEGVSPPAARPGDRAAAAQNGSVVREALPDLTPDRVVGIPPVPKEKPAVPQDWDYMPYDPRVELRLDGKDGGNRYGR